MQALIFANIKEFFTEGHERTVKAKKNIAASFVIKGLNILIGLVLVPLTINYLNPTKYGIWITLSSIIGWFSFFDIGLGNGMRNKFAEALALGNKELAKTYVSTTYATMALIVVVAIFIFSIINPLLNWGVILNTKNSFENVQELSLLAFVIFLFFCLTFFFRLIATILIADQQPARASLFNLYSNTLSLIFIIILINLTKGSLLYLGIIFSGIPVFVFLIANFWFFSGEYKAYRPSLKFIVLSKVKDLFSLGIKFFILQISGILLFQTNNIIITQILGPEEVTPYNIAFKYFGTLMMIFAIIVTPFWSAFTDAWVKKEISWIKKIVSMLIKSWGILFFIGSIMLAISPIVYKVWIGEKIIISFSLSIMVFIWVIINVWNGIFSQFLNGLGKIKIQLLLAVSAALLNIPLALYFGIKIGIQGVLLSNILVVILPTIIYPVQYNKLLNYKAHGIWNK